jgi:hypothetical protein
MGYALAPFGAIGLTQATLERTLHEHRAAAARYERLWNYYRNPSDMPRQARASAGLPAQASGLPDRLLVPRRTIDDSVVPQREIVIENDIAWRVQTMVDFVFGKPIGIRSLAGDAELRAKIELVLQRVWEAAGGLGFLQDFATLGHIFGHADLLLRSDDAGLIAAGASVQAAQETGDEQAARRELLASLKLLRIELVDPRRGWAVLSDHDYREMDAYVVRTQLRKRASASAIARLVQGLAGQTQASDERLEIISRDAWQVYDRGTLTREKRGGLLGRLPIVHVQNQSQPFLYEGLGEVEPLIALQDELNTRLSDRANRVTLQSFKMYLAKGIEGLDKLHVGPGLVWYTDNPDASVQAFGGDAATPGEDAHISEVREALDKASSVPPIAGGVVQGKVGNLTSANALRITLVGLLAKTERKRLNYGRGLAAMSAMVLEVLDAAGLLRTTSEDRGVAIDFADPLPTEASAAEELDAGKLR